MRTALTLFLISSTGFIASGCRTPPNAAMDVPIREEFIPPPEEDRYTKPPESGYRTPPAKKEWGSKPGQNGSLSGVGP